MRVLGYLRLRWALFGLEAKMAVGHLGRIVLAVVVVVVSGGLAYVAGWGALIMWAARCWTDGDPVLPLAVAAGLHAVAAGVAGWWLKTRGSAAALFPETRAEFQEDQKWLQPPNT